MAGPGKQTLKELVLDAASMHKDEEAMVGAGRKLGGGDNSNDTYSTWRKRTFYGKTMSHWVLMTASTTALIVGLSSASLLGRYYYVHGGRRRWVYTWIESAGWPVLAIALLVCYWERRERADHFYKVIKPTHVVTPKVLVMYVGLGGLTAVDNLLYSLGFAYLPLSTNSLLCSSQLIFNAIFSYVLVRQKMSPYVINSVVVISTGTVLLGMGETASNRPPGTSQAQYITGFVVTIAASALYALLLPLLQLLYRSKYMQEKTAMHDPHHQTNPLKLPTTPAKPSFVLVLEVQIALSAVASAFAFLGMCINGDLAGMCDEALHFDRGLLAYIMTLFWSAIGWQLCFLGFSGIIFLSSALMSCVISTTMIPLIPILAVIVFGDSFSALKGIAMMLSMWGFMSYIYDGYVDHQCKKDTNEEAQESKGART